MFLSNTIGYWIFSSNPMTVLGIGQGQLCQTGLRFVSTAWPSGSYAVFTSEFYLQPHTFLLYHCYLSTIQSFLCFYIFMPSIPWSFFSASSFVTPLTLKMFLKNPFLPYLKPPSDIFRAIEILALSHDLRTSLSFHTGLCPSEVHSHWPPLCFSYTPYSCYFLFLQSSFSQIFFCMVSSQR